MRGCVLCVPLPIPPQIFFNVFQRQYKGLDELKLTISDCVLRVPLFRKANEKKRGCVLCVPPPIPPQIFFECVFQRHYKGLDELKLTISDCVLRVPLFRKANGKK